MNISKDQFDRLRELVGEAYKMATLERTNFSHIFAEKDDPLPATEKDVHQFIVTRTRLWRHTWQLPPLRKALQLLLAIEEGEK